MVLKWLSNLTTRSKPEVQAVPSNPSTAQTAVAALAVTVQNIYPPDDQGLPLRKIEDLLAGNESLISRIRLHAAADVEMFDVRFLTPITNLAMQINALPASSSSLFSGAGGLLRASLEMGFLCFQASDGRIFTGADTVEVRHKLEPRWRYICFLAGLLHPIGIPLVRMVVSTKAGASWPKHKYDITTWAQDTKIDRVYVNWSDESKIDQKKLLGPSPYTASILHKIVGHENLGWLEEGSPDLTRTLFELVGGSETTSRIAKDVVSTMWGKVQQREESRRPQAYGRLTVGTHLTPYLVGAMRSLVTDGKWKPNDGPLIVDSTGVYLVWPDAGEEIVRQGAREGRDGWPSSSATLAELLKQDGVFETSYGNDMGMTEVVDKEGNILQSYKLKKPTTVIETYEASDYQKASPKTLNGVLDRDPLASVESKAVAKKSKPAQAKPELETPEVPTSPANATVDQETGEVIASTDANPVLASAGETDSPPENPADTPTAFSKVASEAIQSSAPAPATIPEQGGRIKEAAEVKFSDLVPEEIRKEIKTTLTIELLGKVIKAWRERGEQSTTMRMTDNGAAISIEFLGTLMRSIPDWANEMAAAGLIYAPPDRPGLKVHKVAIPEGSKAKEAIVISRYGCKKLVL
ncbi:MobH family relaxase [Polaromonas aquatica]|uniref:MobH family relaxase n=1 Tax=Polaromonas aquatica TaxID=332657 RepID=A0ABW1TUB4_9BURK